ncbi:MAG: alkaline phosphatase family protein, partial [Actinomycetota bacterium]
MTKTLLLGLDGVTFSILDPAFEAGHMPNLEALLERGTSGVLTSTVPPYTPPGWTSIFTGVNPGKHGIFGFTLGNAQRKEGLVRLDRVQAPALWNAANAQGMRVGLFNIPMTFPPPVVDGWSVSGMLTPEGGGQTPQDYTYPESISKTIADAVGDYEIDIEVNYDEDWKSSAITERLSRNLQRKRAALQALLSSDGDVPLLFAVFEAPDRLMHVHYKYIDPRCEHYSRPEAGPIRARAWSFFDEMDAALGDLIEWAGPDGHVVTMSDHGFGPKDKAVNVNRALHDWGLLGIAGAGSIGRSASLRRVARKVKKVAPKSLWKRAKGAAHSTIDWSQTKAFSAPNPQQGIYVNLEGREPQGTVPATDYDRMREEIIERFTALVDPDDGNPVLDHIYR